jgi:hypothetical protein
MAQDSVVSLFVPVLVLIVLEISQSAREFELDRIARSEQEPFFYSVFYLLHRSAQDTIRIPQLGPFNFIHGMNLGLLYLGYLLILTAGSGLTKYITCVIVGLFWVLFPMVEVDEYVQIMDDPEIQPRSFLVHAVVTTTAASAMFAVDEFVVPIGEIALLSPAFFATVLFVVGLYYTSLLGFLGLLQHELQEAESSL